MKIVNKLIFAGSIAYIINEVLKKNEVSSYNQASVNTETSFNEHKDSPYIPDSAFLHPMCSIIGSVHIGNKVLVGPFSSIRGDEGLRIFVGDYSNIQDGVVLHGLKNFEKGQNIEENSIYVDEEPYSIYIDEQVTLAHQAQVHGPALIESNVFVGMQSFVFNSHIEEDVVIEPTAKVMDVVIPSGRYVPAGAIITSQEEADNLPRITPDYKYYGFNNKVVKVNNELRRGYSREFDLH